MNKKIIFKAISQVAVKYGDKWAKTAGDKAIFHLSEMLKKRGIAGRTYNLQSLTSELKEKYRQGKFNKEEWNTIKSKLRQAWKESRRN